MKHSPVEQRIFDAVIDITSKLWLLEPYELAALAKALEAPELSSERGCRDTLAGFAAVIRNHKEEEY